MSICINCGSETTALYRIYCPSVLKLLKCEKCGKVADKYIEYDPVILLVDMVLLEKQAYRHLLYNSNFKAYWKLTIVIWLSESFRSWSSRNPSTKDNAGATTDTDADNGDILEGNCNFYSSLLHTGLSLVAFLIAVFAASKIHSTRTAGKGANSKFEEVFRAVVIGGCGKSLGLLDVVWDGTESGPHDALIEGYGILCLLTAHAAISNRTSRITSFLELFGGFLAYNYCTKLTTIALAHARSASHTINGRI